MTQLQGHQMPAFSTASPKACCSVLTALAWVWGQREETSRTKRENLKKQKNRKEYDIGWRMDSVPKNSTLAKQMGCSDAPKGLCCLVLDETSRTVKVAATLEPSAAINLEYLLLVPWSDIFEGSLEV